MKNIILILLAILQLFISISLKAQRYNRIEANFKSANGPAPYTLWQWMNGCVTKQGITYDLESFKKVGINSVQQFLVGGSEADITDSSIVILENKWDELMRYALQECNRLEMDFGTHNCPGWSSSGALGLDVQYSMQKIIWSKTLINGKDSKKIKIKRPDAEVKCNYYQDICLIALPRGLSVINEDQIVVIVDGLDKDGRLKEILPEGDWEIIRFGHTTTGKMNLTAPKSGQGLEVDKMSRKALEHFWSLYPAKLIDIAGEYAGNTFKRLAIDSYEVGDQDWTPEMAFEFQKRRDYELFPWLPVLAGYTIESKEISKRFMNDWKRTINELFADNYYGYLEELINITDGMEFVCEPYGTGHKNFDEIAIRGIGDLLMCEFWTKPSSWGWETPLKVSSNAHVNGKKIVSAEAFTGQPQYAFQTDLEDLKSSGDLAFCKGVNLFVLHASAHQPWPEFKPGMTMGWWGTQFGPSQTWWEHGAAEWVQYLKRCQLLLQNGLFVADMCYLQLSSQKYTHVPTGYKADICNEKELLSRFKVEDNKLVLPDGMSYQMLILPNRPEVSPELARKIESLVEDGAIVVGNGFIGSSGLTAYPRSNEEVKLISERLFGAANEREVLPKSIRQIGKGKVYCSYSAQESLSAEEILKDVEIIDKVEDIAWIHREDEGSHYYFLSNQTADKKTFKVGFRVSGMQPEIWDAVTGHTYNALTWKKGKNRTIVDMQLDANGSCFVVFCKKSQPENVPLTDLTIDGKPADINSYISQNNGKPKLILSTAGEYRLHIQDGEVLTKIQKRPSVKINLSKQWDIAFQQKRGAPGEVYLDSLISWTDHDVSGIKYFSGSAYYSRSLQLSKEHVNKSKRIFLDLGHVENIATVTINNNENITLWKAPYTVDITDFCNEGKNLVKIKVTNLWPNRIIGDKLEPEDCIWGEVRDFPYVEPVPVIGRNLQTIPDWVKNNTERPSENRVTFCTFDFFTKDTPLLPAGLIGPVVVSIDDIIEI